MTDINTWREKNNVPIFCGEFSVSLLAPREDNQRWMNEFLSYLKQKNVGWTYWMYREIKWLPGDNTNIMGLYSGWQYEFTEQCHESTDVINLLKKYFK